jgi:hypothetical protein
MPEQTPPSTLDRLWDDIPTGHAPIDHLLTSGRAARRRRHRTVVAGAVAKVAVVLGAGVIGTQALNSGAGRGDDLVAAPAPATRLVGTGQAAVAIPAGWADGAASCNSPVKDTAFFPWPQDCIGPDRYVSSVAITTQDPQTGRLVDDVHLDRHPDGQVAGHEVVASAPDCPVGQGESCQQVFGIPDLDAYFTVTIPEDVEGGAISQIDAIRHSLTVLPDDQTAVPFVTPGGLVSQMREAMEAAGLAVVVHRMTCGPTDSCMSGVVGTTPAAGTVVATGSTVTINVM